MVVMIDASCISFVFFILVQRKNTVKRMYTGYTAKFDKNRKMFASLKALPQTGFFAQSPNTVFFRQRGSPPEPEIHTDTTSMEEDKPCCNPNRPGRA
jgi:hypothetical protein